MKEREMHGLSKTRLYRIWALMKNRCFNINEKSYRNYGARGIDVCNDWLSFSKFYYWAINNGYRERLTLDRKTMTETMNQIIADG